MTSDCLAMPAGSGQGWSDLDVPVADMLTPFQKPDTRQLWEPQPDGYIYRAERADPITGKVAKFAIQMVAAGQHQAKACGPNRYGVARINADGADLMGWDLINFLPNMIAPATQMREAREAGSSDRAASPPPPIGAPIPPIVAPDANQTWMAPGTVPTETPMRRAQEEAARTPASQMVDPQGKKAISTQGATNTYNPEIPAATGPVAGAPTLGPSTATESRASDALYSQNYRSCMANSEAAMGETPGILDCVGAETSRQDALLNHSYRAAIASLPPDRAQALRASERAWLQARDARCKASMGDHAEGTQGSTIYARCMLEDEAKRVVFVQAWR